MAAIACLIWTVSSFAFSFSQPPPGFEPARLALNSANPVTREKAAVGKRLFFDPNLSRSRRISCASCHQTQFATSNQLPVAIGENGHRGERNVPVIFNRVYSHLQFWDGRAASLEEQVTHPIFNSAEMGADESMLLRRLRSNAEYRRLFAAAFPAERPEISLEQVRFALASYLRTLVAANSRYDRSEAGEKGLLSADELAGKELFFQKFRCDRCHSGPNFSNEALSPRCEPAGLETQDYQRYKTPTLRNLARSGPYFHNGALGSLREVISFYEGSVDGAAASGLKISGEEARLLESFLLSLTSEIYELNP